ncbi:anti-sigma factor family protein [Candidatus Avelusimicrobium aviculae]|uniref:anti-sigma factor family protein n=1 Tax=Candidatus Avelusimicrobium aviculae TaxID=3416206 RepID=UPI003D0EBDAC
MNPCDKVMLYAYGELPEQERNSFRQHLEQCAQCRAELKFMQAQQAALLAPAAPAKLVDAVFAQTTRRAPAYKWLGAFKPLWGGVLTAVLAVGLFTGGWMLEHRPGYDSQEVIAYMAANLDEEYQTFASDLAQLEAEF